MRGAKRILVLDGTGICEEGAHEDLMAQNGIYARLYRANLAETKTGIKEAGSWNQKGSSSGFLSIEVRFNETTVYLLHY